MVTLFVMLVPCCDSHCCVMYFEGTNSSVFAKHVVTAIPRPCSGDSKSHWAHHNRFFSVFVI